MNCFFLLPLFQDNIVLGRCRNVCSVTRSQCWPQFSGTEKTIVLFTTRVPDTKVGYSSVYISCYFFMWMYQFSEACILQSKTTCAQRSRSYHKQNGKIFCLFQFLYTLCRYSRVVTLYHLFYGTDMYYFLCIMAMVLLTDNLICVLWELISCNKNISLYIFV